MSLKRYNIDLAFKEPISRANQGLLTALETAIRNAKRLAVKINEDRDNEEDTIRAVWHICHHDTGETCEAEQEI